MQQQPDADNPSGDAETGGSEGHPTQAERVIAKFGGIRPMAAKLAIAVTTVQGWKERGTIPPRRQAEILAAARTAGIDLTEADFAADGAMSDEEAVAEPVEPNESGPWRGASATAPKDAPVIDAPPQPKARSGGGRAALWIVVVLVLAAIAGGAGWWYGRQDVAGVDLGPLERRLAAAEAKLERLPDIEAAAKEAGERAAAAADAVARLETSLKQQAGRIAALESRPAGAAAAPADDGAVRAALDETKQAVAEARAQTERTLSTLRDDVTKTVAAAKDANAQAVADIRAETQRLAGALEAATKRIAALETANAQATAGGARLAALVAAVGQLREAVLAGRPYAAELKAARALEDEPKAPPPALADNAEKGVASVEALRNALGRRAAAIVDAASAPESGDWLDRTLHRLSTIVTVRKTGGDVSGDDPEAIVARAERQLADNDLAGAVATLEALKGPGAEAAAPWLGEAKKTLDASAAVKAMQDEAMARVAKAGGTAPGGAAMPGGTSTGAAPGGAVQ